MLSPQKKLQESGNLKKGTQKATKKGVVRGKKTPAQRAKERAVKEANNGKKVSDYKYNAKTNKATLKKEKMTTDRSAGRWILPQPENVIADEDFLPIPRIARTIPFGYKEDPDDNNQLLPVPRELRALEKAKEYLQQYSYREVANWLTKQTDRSISHMGLKKRIDSEQSNKRRSATLRVWAERYKTAITKAEEIERTRLGARKSLLKGTTDSGEGESAGRA